MLLSELNPDEFSVNVGVHQRSVLPKILIGGIGRKFANWEDSLEIKGLKNKTKKIEKLTVSGSKDELPSIRSIRVVSVEKESPLSMFKVVSEINPWSVH